MATPTPITALETLSEKAANAFKVFLNDCDSLDQYKQFLNTMYHYTGRSAEMIASAGKLAHTHELRTFFDYMLKEEKPHYLLAQKDLEALGDTVSDSIPKTVTEFHNQWFNLGDDIHTYLGAIYVFENIAKNVRPESEALFKRLNLTNKQRRWLAVHLEADLEHGSEITKLCGRYFNEKPDAFIQGGNVMCDAWIAVFTEYDA